MNENPWVSAKEASQKLGVSELTLETWRKIGYLKPGTHWRTKESNDLVSLPQLIVYHLMWCKEEIDYWKSHDAPIWNIAT